MMGDAEISIIECNNLMGDEVSRDMAGHLYRWPYFSNGMTSAVGSCTQATGEAIQREDP